MRHLFSDLLVLVIFARIEYTTRLIDDKNISQFTGILPLKLNVIKQNQDEGNTNVLIRVLYFFSAYKIYLGYDPNRRTSFKLTFKNKSKLRNISLDR